MPNNPVALVLTRQNLPTIDRTKYAPAAGVQKGGYVLADFPGCGAGWQPAATAGDSHRQRERGGRLLWTPNSAWPPRESPPES